MHACVCLGALCVRLRALARTRVYIYTGMCVRLCALALARARVHVFLYAFEIYRRKYVALCLRCT